MALPSKYSVAHAVLPVVSGGHLVRPVDGTGAAIDDPTVIYSVAHPVLETDVNGVAVTDALKVISTPKIVTVSPKGTPVVVVDSTGSVLGTGFGASVTNAILREDGSFLLREDGFFILREDPLVTFTTPVLTETSATGTNPPTWDAVMADLQDGDTVELYFTINGSTPVVGTPNETHIAVATEETITWTTWPTAFANGVTVKWAERYGRDPGTGMVWSSLSNILSDVMPVPANVTGIQRGIYDINGGFGSGPFTKSGVAIAGNSKVVLTVAFWANPLGGQSLTSITANSGAISFTRAAGIAATANKQIWYADVGSVANLDLTFNVGGSTQLIDFSVDELSNAAAGGPSSTYIAEISTSSVDGGLVVPTAPAPGLGIIGLYVNASATYTGATKQAEGAVDGAGQLVSVAYLAATGAVTVSGPSGNRWVINSAWTHA